MVTQDGMRFKTKHVFKHVTSFHKEKNKHTLFKNSQICRKWSYKKPLSSRIWYYKLILISCLLIEDVPYSPHVHCASSKINWIISCNSTQYLEDCYKEGKEPSAVRAKRVSAKWKHPRGSSQAFAGALPATSTLPPPGGKSKEAAAAASWARCPKHQLCSQALTFQALLVLTEAMFHSNLLRVRPRQYFVCAPPYHLRVIFKQNS